MYKSEFLNYLTLKISNKAIKGKNIVIKKFLEKILQKVSLVLVIPPIVFTISMIVGMLFLLGMSFFTINFFSDFILMMDTKLILGTIGIIISLIFTSLIIIGWPIYLIILIGGTWLIKTYRKFIKNHYLYKIANDFVDRV